MENGSEAGYTMGRSVAHDIDVAQAQGYAHRDAVRFVARRALAHADAGRRYSEDYLRQVYELMVATA